VGFTFALYFLKADGDAHVMGGVPFITLTLQVGFGWAFGSCHVEAPHDIELAVGVFGRRFKCES
jgi:hypothetical protein